MINLHTTGLSYKHTHIDRLVNERESGLTKTLHENRDKRKLYPQRNNRAKLNYRDLERGMYEQIRHSTWSIHTSKFTNNNNTNERNVRPNSNDDDYDIIDLTLDDDEQTNDDIDQFHRHLWCICKKPWDHSKLMLRCDSCANWFHGDCVGVTKEEAKELDINGNSFICPTCQELQEYESTTQLAQSSDDPLSIKRKHPDSRLSTTNSKTTENKILSKSVSNDESRKRPKIDVSLQHSHSLSGTKVQCITNGCNNTIRKDWIYCSSICIRRHINDTLQSIQRSQGKNPENIPTREDISLFDNKSKTILDKSFVPKIEDLYTWINQHPSYEIIESSTRVSISLQENQSKNVSRSLSSSSSNTAKSKVVPKPEQTNKQKLIKPILNKNIPTKVQKPTNVTNNAADIRSKVPTTLYDKILLRLEKNGETHMKKDDIRFRVKKIEEEMFRVYGKIDNAYKNKFRSLIANISNMNNNFFYKHILLKDVTTEQIVAMKPEDMLPPEEKEKRKDQFEKEVQLIIHAEQQIAEERARRARIKATQQDFVDYDAVLPTYISQEQCLSDKKINKSKENLSINTTDNTNDCISTTNKSDKETTLTSMSNLANDQQAISIVTSTTMQTEDLSLTKKTTSNTTPESLPVPTIPEKTNLGLLIADADNDYIEPESPTGADALIYDEDDNDDVDDADDDGNDLKHINATSNSNESHSSTDYSEFMIPSTPIIRDDYNPSKAQSNNQQISIINSKNKWLGTIYPSDIKIACESFRIYGENDHLIENIPQHLIILGRLRIRDLWEFVRSSLTVRDVLILTLISSTLNTNNNDIFSNYVDTLNLTKRAAVISKCSSSCLIRDMYILAADTTECPSNVLLSLSLPATFESKQLFLIVIGSEKKTMKLSNRSNENLLANNLVYNPIVLQDSTLVRDPRLSKAKDALIHRNTTVIDHSIISTSQPNQTRKTFTPYSQEDLLKFIDESLVRIRNSVKSEHIHSIVTSTVEILTANKRDDLCVQFNDRLRIIMNDWQAEQSNPSTITGDNLIEENMEVDDDNDDQNKKTVTSSIITNRLNETHDFDYRFVEQGANNNNATTPMNDKVYYKQRRKSRFSDRPSIDDDDEASNKSTNKCINSSESPLLTICTKDKLISQSSRFSFSKDALRRHKSNVHLTTVLKNNHDLYESSPKYIEDLMKQIQSYGYQGLSLSNDNWIKKTLPTTPVRSTAMLNLVIQQQQQQHKTNSRFSSYTNECRSSNNIYMTHYHDFDQPQE